MEERLVEKTIHALQKRLYDGHNLLQIQVEEGYVYNATCTFNPPATNAQIAHFENETGHILPEDYKAFLKITNGCRLFDDVKFGGETYLYSLEEINEYNRFFDEFEDSFTIAYVYQDHIVINTKRQPFMFWKGHIDSFDEARPLQLNFEQWLDRFIMCQGAKFWLW